MYKLIQKGGLNRLVQIYRIKVRLFDHENTFYKLVSTWRIEQCVQMKSCEEDSKPHNTEKFLGGSKISYSIPHNRDAHTHTNLIRLHTVVRHNTKPSTHTRLISSTPSSTHTHGCWAQHQALHTHTQRTMFRLKRENNLLSSTRTNLGEIQTKQKMDRCSNII